MKTETPVAWYHPDKPNNVINAAQFPHVLEKNKVGYLPCYLAAALPPPGRGMVPMDWQPIETAPKDGTEIILRRGDRVGSAGWIKWPSSEHEEAGEGWTIGHDGDSWDEDQAPTHWMRLPPPPHGIKEGS